MRLDGSSADRQIYRGVLAQRDGAARDEPRSLLGGENHRMGSLLVITGPPGAGKTTVASLVAKQTDPSVLIARDAFFAFLAQGAIPPWLRESQAQNEVVTRAAAAATGRFAATYTTVYDGVIRPWSLPTFATETGLEKFDYVILLPSVEECLNRVMTREGHEFSEESATRKMHNEFHRAQIEQRHVLRDPPGTPGAVAREILRRAAAGSLAHPASAPARCPRLPQSP